MLVAELRRKLPDVTDIDPKASDAVAQVRALLKESREDLLTSDVFGSMKYLPRRPYLESVLKLVAERNPRSLSFRQHLPALLAELDKMKFQFWHGYPTPAGFKEGGMTEPDVVLETSDTFLVIEAKLGSGVGTQQIERELAVALDQSGDSRQAFVLLVTTSLSVPHFGPKGKHWTFAQYLDARIADKHLADGLGERLKEAVDRVLWIDWAGILTALKAARSAIPSLVDASHALQGGDLVDDLLAVAEMRGIRLFEGVGVFGDQPHAELRPVLISGAVPIAALGSADAAAGSSVAFDWQALAMRHNWSCALRLLLKRS